MDGWICYCYNVLRVLESLCCFALCAAVRHAVTVLYLEWPEGSSFFQHVIKDVKCNDQNNRTITVFDFIKTKVAYSLFARTDSNSIISECDNIDICAERFMARVIAPLQGLITSTLKFLISVGGCACTRVSQMCPQPDSSLSYDLIFSPLRVNRVVGRCHLSYKFDADLST